MTALLALQTGVLALLEGDSAVMALVTGVHDHVPQTKAYPYIVLGEKTEDPRPMLQHDGVRDTITLHIWSAYSGDKEALQVLAAVRGALDDRVIDLGAYGPGRLRFDFVSTLREEGVRHVPVRYRVAGMRSAA